MSVPAGHDDLLDRPLDASLTTHFANGRLQQSVVWFWREAGTVCLTTMTEFAKARNLRERPRATLFVWDDDGRWLELRATVDEVAQTPREALADCDDAGFRHCGVRPYFGGVVAAEWAGCEHPVTFRLTPRVVVAGAVVGPASGAHDEPTPPTHDEAAPPPPTPDEPALPDDHLDLLTGPSVALLATRDPGGHARVRPTPCGLVGGRASVAVTTEQSGDLARDPRATLLVVDPGDAARWMEVRADTRPDGDGRVTLVARRVVLDAIHP